MNQNDQNMPETPQALQEVRDRLRDYLASLEKGESNAGVWLNAHETAISIGYHWIDRAITLKMQNEAVDIIHSLADTAGFVLSLQDFGARAEKTFGVGSTLAKEIAKHKNRLPENIFTAATPPALPQIPESLVHAPPPKAEPTPEKKWWKPGTWFAKETPAPDMTAEHAAEQTEWQKLRDDITTLQSEKHYYVDSLMDWVGDTLAPENGSADDTKMDSYKDPQHIAELAAADHKQNISRHADYIAERAQLYGRLAATLDEQRIGEFAATLPALFPKKDTEYTKHLRQLFFEDYGVASFAELALKYVARRDDQLLLFKAALELEPGIAFKGLHTREEILARIKRETNADRNPLDREALRLVRKKLDMLEDREHETRRRSRPPEEEISLTDLFKRALEGFEKMLDRAANPAPSRPRPRR